MKIIEKSEIPAFLRKWQGKRSVIHASEDLGVSPQSFHLWLRGKGLPRDESLKKLGLRWVVLGK